MINADADWMNTIANRLDSADLSIVGCIIAIIFFMRFNRHEGKNKANQIIGICLGAGFLMLVIFRIVKDFL